MRNNLGLVLILLFVIVSSGCSPRVRVRKDPGPKDTGIRYYRPKPYLKVEPAGSVVTEGKVSTTTPSDEYVSISLEYLPDFSEEYSIEVCPGLGSAVVDIGLQDGWNLTTVNQNLDSQFDDNVSAVAELATAATGFIPTTKGLDGAPMGSTQKFVVAATNVPIGYYESVIGRDTCGKKRLYGFRYVGFLPFSSCPTEMCGADQLSCQTVPAEIYGIVFKEGVMRFERLDTIDASSGTKRDHVSTGTFVVSGEKMAIKQLEKAVRLALLETQGLSSGVNANLAGDGAEVEIAIVLEDSRPIDEELIRDIVTYVDVETALEGLGRPIPEFKAAVPDQDSTPDEDLPAPADDAVDSTTATEDAPLTDLLGDAE